jgi:hypothetical protein
MMINEMPVLNVFDISDAILHPGALGLNWDFV